MSLITIPNTFSAGAVIIASQHNSNFTTIVSDYNGSIDNNNISATAAIAYTKLNLLTSIVNADVSASAAIVGSKLNLVSPGAIGTTTPAAGKFTTLEATSTFKVGTTNQGDIFYDNGTSIVRLTPGTSGQALLTGGAAANPSWGAAGALSFVSNTSVSAATNSGDIAITTGNYYKVIAQLGNLSGVDTLLIRINNNTGNNYGYAYNGRTSGGALTGGAEAANAITVGTSMSSNAIYYWNAEFNVHALTSKATVFGKLSYVDSTGGLVSFVDFSGFWTNATVTSFRLLTSGGATMTGNVYLYKYTLS